MKLSPVQIKELEVYAPDNHPAKAQYLNMVNTMVMGTDKSGRQRPIADLFYFLQVSKNAGLDPTLKQIYAVYRWNSSQGKEVMSIQTGIDGMRTIAERTGLYAGSDDAVCEYVDKKLAKATVTVYKLNPKTGERMPITASARWDEYCPGERQDMMWKKMPHVMLAKVAEALALRKAFPIASQIYVQEEMAQAVEKLPEPVRVDKAVKTAKPTNFKEIEAIFKNVKEDNEKNL